MFPIHDELLDHTFIKDYNHRPLRNRRRDPECITKSLVIKRRMYITTCLAAEATCSQIHTVWHQQPHFVFAR